jgi:hypothetical protein
MLVVVVEGTDAGRQSVIQSKAGAFLSKHAPAEFHQVNQATSHISNLQCISTSLRLRPPVIVTMVL